MLLAGAPSQSEMRMPMASSCTLSNQPTYTADQHVQRASLAEGYVTVRGGQAWLVGVQINEYPWAHQQNHAPTRERKLLLHRREIGKLDSKLTLKGYSAVPLAIYLKNGRIKIEIGIGRGKKQYEKRETVKEAEAKREIDRALRRR